MHDRIGYECKKDNVAYTLNDRKTTQSIRIYSKNKYFLKKLFFKDLQFNIFVHYQAYLFKITSFCFVSPELKAQLSFSDQF